MITPNGWRLIRELLDLCSGLRSAHEAPAWKREIEQIIEQRIAHLSSDYSDKKTK